MRPIVAALCFVLLSICSAQAQTASVIPVQGDLSLNQGQGFQRVDSRVSANVGDSLMVSPGGAAMVVYQDGCQVTVQPGAVTTIAPLSPCASGSLAEDQPQFVYPPPLVAGAAIVAIAGVIVLGVEIARPQRPASP